MVNHDFTCKVAGFGIGRDVSNEHNIATNLRIRWAAPELLPSPEYVATLSWRKSDDSGLDVLPQLLANQEITQKQEPKSYTQYVAYTIMNNFWPCIYTAMCIFINLTFLVELLI